MNFPQFCSMPRQSRRSPLEELSKSCRAESILVHSAFLSNLCPKSALLSNKPVISLQKSRYCAFSFQYGTLLWNQVGLVGLQYSFTHLAVVFQTCDREVKSISSFPWACDKGSAGQVKTVPSNRCWVHLNGQSTTWMTQPCYLLHISCGLRCYFSSCLSSQWQLVTCATKFVL